MYYLAIQNTITKKISVYELEFIDSNTVYHKFKIQTDEPDGEYIYLLFESNNKIDIDNITFITEMTDATIYLTSGVDLLTADTKLLIVGDEQILTAIATGLLKITYNGN